MRLIKISIVAVAMVGLSACSTFGERYGFMKDEAQSYRKEPPVERTVIIPQNLSSKNVQDYYEVPASTASTDAPTVPPLVPPGSSLTSRKPVTETTESQQDRIRNAENAKIQGHVSAAANVPATNGVSFPQAWAKVGQILKSYNYKIVEKDKAMGVYYVVDTQNSGGKVTKDMPIYQVHLKPSGYSTIVSVSPGNTTLQNQLNRNLND